MAVPGPFRRWNPFITSIEVEGAGTPEKGSKLKCFIKPPGHKGKTES